MNNIALGLGQVGCYVLALLGWRWLGISSWLGIESADWIILTYVLLGYIYLLWAFKIRPIFSMALWNSGEWWIVSALPNLVYASVLLLISILWSTISEALGATYGGYGFKCLFMMPIILGFVLLHSFLCFKHGLVHSKTDEYGALILGRGPRSGTGDFLRMLALKAFFLPFMYFIIYNITGILLQLTWPKNLAQWAMLAFYGGVMLDVVVGFIGYVFTTRLFDNEILDVEPDWRGWVFCLICYPPFVQIIKYIQQHTVLTADNWANGSGWVYTTWLILLSLSWVIYWWSTLVFGIRFSNLSWRGLVDHGPYAFCRHPAYLSKNIYWWLCLLPLLPHQSIWMAIAMVLGLMCVSLIYYGRACSESRHLSRFAEYQNYSCLIHHRHDYLFKRLRLR